MIRETLEQIEATVRNLKAADPKKKEELAKLVARLKAEVEGLSRTHGEQAESIAGFAHLAARESTRASRQEELRELSLQGLKASVEGFEASHPKLVQTVNDIAMLLSGIGI